MRTHIDDYAGKVGFILYLNRNWSWDWGGLLSIAAADDLVVEYPLFNRLVVIAHEKFRLPHFVSTISEFALNERHTIIGFSPN